jgi:hypothetical protein
MTKAAFSVETDKIDERPALATVRVSHNMVYPLELDSTGFLTEHTHSLPWLTLSAIAGQQQLSAAAHSESFARHVPVPPHAIAAARIRIRPASDLRYLARISAIARLQLTLSRHVSHQRISSGEGSLTPLGSSDN